MPIVHTRFRPWEDLEVSEEEAASLRSMGLLSSTGSVEPAPAAPEAPEAPAAPAAEAPAASDASAPAAARRTKTSTPSAPPEEVKTDGSSEEGSAQVQEG